MSQLSSVCFTDSALAKRSHEALKSLLGKALWLSLQQHNKDVRM